MSLIACKVGGKDGFKSSDGGTCHTHDGSAAGKKAARKKAVQASLKAVVAPSATSQPTYAERPWWVPRR